MTFALRLGPLLAIAKGLALGFLSLFALWFVTVFAMGGWPQLSCSYGNLSGFFVKRSAESRKWYCAEQCDCGSVTWRASVGTLRRDEPTQLYFRPQLARCRRPRA